MKIVLRLFKLVVYVSLMYTIYYYIDIDEVTIEIEQSKCYILNDVSKFVVSENLSDNIVKCNISGISNLVNNMVRDDWSITKLDVNEEFIDVILEKDNVVCRVYYESDGVLTLIATPYEKSKELISYMYDKGEG